MSDKEFSVRFPLTENWERVLRSDRIMLGTSVLLYYMMAFVALLCGVGALGGAIGWALAYALGLSWSAMLFWGTLGATAGVMLVLIWSRSVAERTGFKAPYLYIRDSEVKYDFNFDGLRYRSPGLDWQIDWTQVHAIDFKPQAVIVRTPFIVFPVQTDAFPMPPADAVEILRKWHAAAMDKARSQ